MKDAKLKFVDVSAQYFGKYQHCTLATDGMWYADSDMIGSRPKRGALPSPRQDTPAARQRALELHECAAKAAADRALGIGSRRATFLDWVWSLLGKHR